MKDYFEASKELHKFHKGKISVQSKINITTIEDLSLVYTPGVAGPCTAIFEDPSTVWDYTLKANSVAIVTDGSAVLGLGNIGAEASIPVMEGKAMLFKKFGGINAFPICLNTQDPEKIVETVRIISPVFGGINLEDIAAPNSFYVETALQDLGIPVFHDDQHGTAIVVLAGLLNACKLAGKEMKDLSIVVNGAGAAGVAISKLLRCVDNENDDICIPVKEIVLCDSKGIVQRDRANLSDVKKELLWFSNPHNKKGDLRDALKGADVFIGVSKGKLLKREDIQLMNDKAIIFALANPIPEIMPDEAKKGGAFIIATGRSDFPNQVNNVLAFPGIFRGALDARAKRITPKMKLAAAHAIASCVHYPSIHEIIPSSLSFEVASQVALAVQEAYESD